MKQRRQFDLVIVGADAPGLAAAACAARRRADIELRVAVVRTGDEPSHGASAPGVPDFVWRQLDLHRTALQARPVEALVSVFEDGRMLATSRNGQRMKQILDEACGGIHNLYTDFSAEMRRLWNRADEIMHGEAARPFGGALLAALASEDSTALALSMTQDCEALLDDYFSDEAFKTHLTSVALMPFGLGGDEPGSALALAAANAPAAWRLRAGDREPSLVKVLEDVCKAASVAIIDGAVRDIEAPDDKTRHVILSDGEALRTPIVMASRAMSEIAARLGAASAASTPMGRREGACAEARVKLARPADPPGGSTAAIFYAAGSIDALQAARDAALVGRLPDDPPIYFEFVRDEIHVRAPYCPAVFYTDDQPRDWSEQDRQALGRQLARRLSKLLNGAAHDVRRVDVKVFVRSPAKSARGPGVLIVPPACHDEIGAAARLAMDLVHGA
ncbi:hypothetical protein [Amphiplicatus metriothermophilus]|uniref:Phytoene dehydrogenase-related protein n=1 Tax=Amphiplicatus metriothermophilus TaxID=1519374 RepID=A0A239PUV4_9PROT|nr:hypothetical protein [Amphiplicatus metriothermophilus]MBB5519358.1 phytoene dehydrogenase-like protein [Amphiplicatus metriothermophilus]SNT73467.1 Phytoene dehydrogenase-related protein [Amphiplicatus metriothermophilus]